MTDYKSLKLIASSSPHIRSNENTRSLMLDVIIAMLPALAVAVWKFGFRALVGTLVSVAGCMFFEWGYRAMMHKDNTVPDLSAVVTGMLIAFVCPVQLPIWTMLIGDFFAIIVVKQLFGGIGKNFLNPALAARAFLLASYSVLMTSWIDPNTSPVKAAIFGTNVDVVTSSTPMAFLHANDLAGLKETGIDVVDMLVGNIGGSMGEISAVALLLGGAYLLLRKVISWQIPVSYIGTVALLTFLFPRGNSPMEWMLYNIFGGGLMLGAFFMATDYVSSPVTKKGQLIFGLGCGLITVFIRYFGSYPEGVCYSILVMNCCVWLIDKISKPVMYGAKKKEADAK